MCYLYRVSQFAFHNLRCKGTALFLIVQIKNAFSRRKSIFKVYYLQTYRPVCLPYVARKRVVRIRDSFIVDVQRDSLQG